MPAGYLRARKIDAATMRRRNLPRHLLRRGNSTVVFETQYPSEYQPVKIRADRVCLRLCIHHDALPQGALQHALIPRRLSPSLRLDMSQADGWLSFAGNQPVRGKHGWPVEKRHSSAFLQAQWHQYRSNSRWLGSPSARPWWPWWHLAPQRSRSRGPSWRRVVAEIDPAARHHVHAAQSEKGPNPRGSAIRLPTPRASQ